MPGRLIRSGGLLLVLIGRATHLNLLMGLPKNTTDAQFGAVSTTADPTGEIAATGQRVTATEVVTTLTVFADASASRCR